jgi:lysophospholipase L1-like esterase
MADSVHPRRVDAHSVRSRLQRFTVVGALAVTALASVIALGGGGAVAATQTDDERSAVTAGSGYLALGDSIVFGFRETANLPTPDYSNAANFAGYPENVSDALDLRLTNASCPGETSSSFVAENVPSNGCENGPFGSIGYRARAPLHAQYRGTQLRYAIHYLRENPHTRLVSLMIGANDALLCQHTTSDGCASELPAVLAQISTNVRTILGSLRGDAGYRGKIVIVSYYSLDYSSLTLNALSQTVNAAVYSAALPYTVVVADGYGLLENAAAQAGGASCTAGLLTSLTTGGCGVHPSVAGQSLLALALERAIKY